MAQDYYIRRDRWRQKLDTDHSVQFSTRIIGGLIASMCSPDQPIARPSQPWIARKTGCSRPTVERAIRQLKDLGYIEVAVCGGMDFGTGQTWANRYKPIFEIADKFSLGDELSAPSPMMDSTITHDGTAPSPMMDESDRRSGAATGSSAPAPGLPRPVENSTNNFSEFLNLARSYPSKAGTMLGRAGIETIESSYTLALGVPGDTAEKLYDDYRDQLEKWKGNSGYTGDYALRWLKNRLKTRAKNYTGAENDKSAAIDKNTGHSAEASSGPGAATGNSNARTGNAMPSEYYAVMQWLPKAVTPAVMAESKKQGTDFYEYCRRFCALAMSMKSALDGPEISRVIAAMDDPDYQTMREETESWSWKYMSDLVKTDDWDATLQAWCRCDDETEVEAVPW